MSPVPDFLQPDFEAPGGCLFSLGITLLWILMLAAGFGLVAWGLSSLG